MEEVAMRVLILTGTLVDDTEVVSFLRKHEIPYVSIDFRSFVLEEIGIEEYGLCIFVLKNGNDTHLQCLRAIKKNLNLSGQLGPPVVFIVEENKVTFEQSARIAEIDIYLTSPVAENVLSSLLKLQPITE